MKAALSQAIHAGFIYVNAILGDEDRGVTDDSEQPKINPMGNIQVRKLVESRVIFIFVAAAA